MSRASQVIVLVEDKRQREFVRYFLKRVGYSNHHMRIEALAGGRGSGEKWVRDHYPRDVAAYRSRSTRAHTALVVAIDADTESVDRRQRQLQDALIETGMDPRADRESIVHLVPKRSIETWILCLCGQGVDEEADYRRAPDIDNERIATAAGRFFDCSRSREAPAPCVPSLLQGLAEVRRLQGAP